MIRLDGAPLYAVVYLDGLIWIDDVVEVIRTADPQAGGHRSSNTRCYTIPSTIYKRPDPFIYSQYDLMEHGLAVTWDNLDIRLFLNGQLVPSTNLVMNTTYDIHANIHNGSTDAPAPYLGVEFSYLSFGIGTIGHPIGKTVVHLPVKGVGTTPEVQDGCIAVMPWTTPPEEGHYCLQVRLIWFDDANPNNNLGQENTQVGHLQSPATFKFPIRNGTHQAETYTLKVDGYYPPQPVLCSTIPEVIGIATASPLGETGISLDHLSTDALNQLICSTLAARHAVDRFPIPDGWTVDIQPPAVRLEPDQTQEIIVTITAPDGIPDGRQVFNINAFDSRDRLYGGVTLYVDHP